MDEAVLRALAKWPNVPACVGWLALDRRGRWRMRDEHAQRHGLLGDVIRQPTLKAFIDRNYARDPDGAWFFQNGPQRVYVDLDGGPFVFFADGDPLRFTTHTGRDVREVHAVHVDDAGQFWLETDAGCGLVCDRDLAIVVERLRDASGRMLDPDEVLGRLGDRPHTLRLVLAAAPSPLELRPLQAAEAPARFGFVARPALAGTPR